jgi:very-short-patch-repair endonuclease
MRLRGTPPTRSLARKLRREMSPAERRLWRHLRGDPEGLHFRRQHQASPYVLDFYCARARLAIELDGTGHRYGDQPQHDARRDAWLAANGITSLRIPADALLHHLDGVLRHILETARSRYASTPLTSPNSAPSGSSAWTMRSPPGTSIGPLTTLPPAASIRPLAASTSSTRT